jgi:hypothetical protein
MRKIVVSWRCDRKSGAATSTAARSEVEGSARQRNRKPEAPRGGAIGSLRSQRIGSKRRQYDQKPEATQSRMRKIANGWRKRAGAGGGARAVAIRAGAEKSEIGSWSKAIGWKKSNLLEKQRRLQKGVF